MPAFEWDAAKAAQNLVKHKVSFEVAVKIWDGPALEVVDDRDYGEERFIAYGAVEDRVLAVVFT